MLNVSINVGIYVFCLEIEWFVTSVWESEGDGRHYLNTNRNINIIHNHMQRIEHILGSKLDGGK